MIIVVESIGTIKIIPSNRAEKEALDNMFRRFEEMGMNLENTKFSIRKDGGGMTQLLISPLDS